MLRKGLIKPPLLRAADAPARERHATWLELFYDLVFVASISQLALGLSADSTPAGLLRFAVLFVPVWWAWIGQTYYLTRFDSNDVGHRLLTMALIVVVASLTVHARDGLGTRSAGFALSYAAVRFILVAEYLRAGWHIPAARPLTNRYSLGFGLAAALWALSPLLPPPSRFSLWGVALAIDFLTPLTAGDLHVRFPPHLVHLPERFGLFTIIVLGEAVVSVVAEVAGRGLTRETLLAGLCGLLVAFALWWGYFEGVRGAEARRLSVGVELTKYQVWIYTHLPLVMGITCLAVQFKHLVDLPRGAALPAIEAWMLCGSVGVVMVTLNVLLEVSTSFEHGGELHTFMLPHYLLALLTVAAGALNPVLTGLQLAGLVTALCVAQVLLSLRELPGDTVDLPT